MPSRNTIREFASNQYYHVYNRGVEKRNIFLDEQDYATFLSLLKKYLTGENDNPSRNKFDNLQGEVKLLAYCLMPNHFHFVFYQLEKDSITKLMRRVSTAYVTYFNKRHKRVGSLFQGKYRASLIDKDEYLTHITRYIHLNPLNHKSWPYSSYEYYKGSKYADWLDTSIILGLFSNREEYLQFIEDYKAYKDDLDDLKWQLANGAELQ